MATAKQLFAERLKVVRDVVGVTVDLTLNEAQFLVQLLGRVGGHPQLSRRAHADAIRDALLAVCDDLAPSAAATDIVGNTFCECSSERTTK